MIEILVAFTVMSIALGGGFFLMEWRKEQQFWELQKQLEYELYRSWLRQSTV